MFKDGIGIFLWKLAVALYLVANGVLGLIGRGGDFRIILTNTMRFPSWVATIVAVLALAAGVMVLIEMFSSQAIRVLDLFALILAIIWAVYIIIGLVSFFTGKSGLNIWEMLQRLGVHTMVLGSLLVTAKKGK
ncbi:MAG: hypothetical protein FWB86_06900 [Treponema sp.]|nr:hypothetical protein [Treponema sp.]MCL2250850.1 hypothetical protein [Treponema sp.]